MSPVESHTSQPYKIIPKIIFGKKSIFICWKSVEISLYIYLVLRTRRLALRFTLGQAQLVNRGAIMVVDAHERSDDSILIIGGGLAGLAAARAITAVGVRRAVVLEAGPSLGGRCCQTYVGGVCFEAGCEFLHGGDSTSKQLADAIQLPTEQVFTAAHGDGGPDDAPAPDGGVAYYSVGGRLLAYDSTDVSFVALNRALEQLSSSNVPDHDRRSLHDYLCDNGVNESMIRLAEASYSNTLGVGSDLRSLPLRQVAQLEQLWGEHDGEGDYRVKPLFGEAAPSLANLCAALAAGATVHTSAVVVSLEVKGGAGEANRAGAVTVRCTDGRVFTGSAAIIAVPVTVLQRGSLNFSPRLPDDKV